LKFKQRSRDRHHTSFGGGFLTPGVELAIVDAFAKFKEHSFKPKTITWSKPRSFRGNFYLWSGTCRSRSTYQISVESIPEISMRFEIFKKSRDPDHAPFEGKFLLLAGTCHSRSTCQIWAV